MKSFKPLTIILSAIIFLSTGCKHIESVDTHVSDSGILIISADNSEVVPSCPEAYEKALKMEKVLEKYGEVTVLANKNATLYNVVCKMLEYAKKEIMIVYFCGYGGSHPKEYIPQIGNEQCICLYDDFLALDSILQIIYSAENRAFFIFDCIENDIFEYPYINTDAYNSRSYFPRESLNFLCWSSVSKIDMTISDMLYSKFNKKASYKKQWDSLAITNSYNFSIGTGFDGSVFK